MTLSRLWLLLPLAAVMSGLFTGALHRYALAYGVLDIPNERSAHSTPTPRGGGVAIVVAFLTLAAASAAAGAFNAVLAISLIGSGVIVALIGFMDDHRSIAVPWRLAAHAAAAGWILWWLGGLPTLTFGGLQLQPGWAGHVTAAVGLVWLLNLYNFMDGIDGLAGFEAVTVGCAATLLYWSRGVEQSEWFAPALLAMAALGFLWWNWPPARIFMGDAGSGFIGLMLGAMVVRAAWLEEPLFWGWVILLGVFVVDATVTLFRRLMRVQPLHKSHNEHAYQHAANQLLSHYAVTLAVGAINIFWLLPVAFAVSTGWLSGPSGVIMAYLPLVGLAIRFRAGCSPQPSKQFA